MDNGRDGKQNKKDTQTQETTPVFVFVYEAGSGSVGVVCLDRNLASLPLPEHLQEVEKGDKILRQLA